jgi:hypothetical protein
VYGYYVFQNPPYKASRQLLIPRIANFGTSFSPLPCQAWHGYGVTSAHRVEVDVGTDGHASAPPSGAAAAAPPAGASFEVRISNGNKTRLAEIAITESVSPSKFWTYAMLMHKCNYLCKKEYKLCLPWRFRAIKTMILSCVSADTFGMEDN